jgi:predicted N-acetyltransferase YhbS
MLVVRWLPPGAARDPSVVARVTDVVVRAYEPAGVGLWSEPRPRTSDERTREAIAEGEIAVAELDGEIVGVVRSVRDDAEVAWFGPLAVEPRHARHGIGDALVAFVEEETCAAGARVMELEVLSADPPLAQLAWLPAWYARRGYREVSRTPLERSSPGRPDLLVRCDEIVMRRPLSSPSSGG